MKCTKCNRDFSDKIVELEIHLAEDHFIDFRTFAESELESSAKDECYFCYRCKNYRNSLTNILPDQHYLPCWSCIGTKRSELNNAIQTTISGIKELYDRILGDRYYQLFIVDDIYMKTTLPHDYLTFKTALSKLELPSRNDIWFLDWFPGYPKLISESNLSGLKIVNLSKYFNIESDKDNLTVNDYNIQLPELVPYDVKHHSRYSILNKGSDRKTKRLRFSGTSNCIKFFNTELENTKSILKLLKNNEDISTKDLSYKDFVVIKLAILRNKTIMRKIYEVIYELIKSANLFRDSVFLKNTVPVDPKTGNVNISLSWLPEYKENFINISIL